MINYLIISVLVAIYVYLFLWLSDPITSLWGGSVVLLDEQIPGFSLSINLGIYFLYYSNFGIIFC